MRRLGAALGVEAMSLYHYVANKDDLLDAVMALLYNEIEIPTLHDAAEWRDAVRSSLRSFNRVLLAHPAALTLFAARPANSPEAFLALHRGFCVLRDAGLGPAEAYGSLNFAVSYVMGHASEAFRGSDLRVFDVGPPEMLNDPALADFVGAGKGLSSQELFEIGLELVISALGAHYDLA